MTIKGAVLLVREKLCRDGLDNPAKRFIRLACDKYLVVNGFTPDCICDTGALDEIPDQAFRNGPGVIGRLYQLFITPEKDEAFALLSKNVRLTAKRVPAATQLFTPEWISRYMAENSIGRAVRDAGVLSADEFNLVKSKWRYYVEDVSPRDIVAGNREVGSIRVIDPCMGAGQILLCAFDVMMDVYQALGYDKSRAAGLILKDNLFGADIDENVCMIARFALNAKAAEFDGSLLGNDLSENLALTAQEHGSLSKELGFAKYDAVIANPPYMGRANMPITLADYIQKEYPNGQSDLFAAFIIRCRQLTRPNGYTALITQQAWMFLKSFKKLRLEILAGEMVSMLHLGSRAFEDIGGEVVQTVAFVTRNAPSRDDGVQFARLVDESFAAKEEAFLSGRGRYAVKQSAFSEVPDSVIAYWAGERLLAAFKNPPLKRYASPRQGLATGDNDRFTRMWHELPEKSICFDATSRKDAILSGKRWFPFNKGGKYRKWYGNDQYVVDWSRDGFDIRNLYENGKQKSRPQNLDCFFLPSTTWSKVSSNDIAFRYKPAGFVFDVSGTSMFSDEDTLMYLLAFCNSSVAREISRLISPTMNYEVGQIASFPVAVDGDRSLIIGLARECVRLSREDWDSFETSWNFSVHPMLENRVTGGCCDERAYVETSYALWKIKSQSRFDELRAIEQRINREFARIYRIDDIDSSVDASQVSVRRVVDACEKGVRKSRFIVTKSDAVKSLISYAIGCAFGRFKPFGEDCADGSRVIVLSSNPEDSDGALSCLKRFLIKAYSRETLDENLRFIALALSGGKNAKESVISKYFSRDFITDHNKLYQNRPIYWLFSDGKAFNVLTYMHGVDQSTIAKLKRAAKVSGLEKSPYYEALSKASDLLPLNPDEGVKRNYALFQGIETVDGEGDTVKTDLLNRLQRQ